MDHERGLLVLFAIGVAAAVGKALQSAEKIPLRVYIGRSLVGGVTASIAASVLTVVPNLPFAALVGLACFCGTVGAESLMKFAGDYLARKAGKTDA